MAKNKKYIESSEPTTAPEDSVEVPVRKPKKNALKPDRWLITPISYLEDGTEVSSELIYYKNDKPIMKIPVTEDNFRDLLEALQVRFSTNDNSITPDEWFIRTPPVTVTNPTPEPVLSFTNKTRVLMALPMNQDFLKKFSKSIDTYVVKAPAKSFLMNSWWKKHKFWRVVLLILIFPFFFALLTSIGYFVNAGA